ncbi:MAG: lysine--tRNA ligase [Alphaproteobacteria bacterium]|nr:lysine--tRNA ligase [Alphaproteobacteria bacterium]
MTDQTAANQGHDQRQVRVEKLHALERMGINPYPAHYKPDSLAAGLQEKYKDLPSESLTGDTVTVAGRIRALRNSGMFIDLHDETGKIQVYSHGDHGLEDDSAKLLEYVDIGDIIGVRGTVRRTKRGELTVDSKQITMLCKSLLPLPEKHHGLTDVEKRYRQRYLDLIVNEQSKAVLLKRTRMVAKIRRFMEDRGFVEFETPILHTVVGGATAKPFFTHHNALGMDMSLRIATELHLKRLVVGGFPRVYEMGRIFRNEGVSIKHNPEFTSIEFYQAYADYEDMMKLCEDLMEAVAIELNGTTKVTYGGKSIDFKGPFKRAKMTDLVKQATGVDFMTLDLDGAKAAVKKLGIAMTGKENWGQLIALVFDEKCEHKLVQPTHVTHYPTDISPLAKKCPEEPRLTQRFEIFANGWEIGNAFSELTNPLDQRERFEEQVRMKAAGDEEANDMDEDFLTALEYGMPPTGGMGIGIERLAMLMTDSASIRDILPFPTMRKE